MPHAWTVQDILKHDRTWMDSKVGRVKIVYGMVTDIWEVHVSDKPYHGSGHGPNSLIQLLTDIEAVPSF